MPQLNPDTFLAQAVWLAITFVVLYLIIWRAAVPRISQVLRERRERIDGDLEKAAQLKAQAEEVLETYQAALAEGRAEAQSAIRETADRVAQEAEARHAALAEKLRGESEAAEQRIADAKALALKDIAGVAADVAQAAAAKLTGTDVKAAEAEQAVTAVMEERD